MSEWGADLIDITQPDCPNNSNSNDRDDRQDHPLPSDWSDQENFWSGKTYDKVRPTTLKPVQMPPPKHDSEESHWNDNLYPHQYRAKVQSQVAIRQPPPGWSNWYKELAAKNKSVNNNVNSTNTENQSMLIIETVSISREAFDNLN